MMRTRDMVPAHLRTGARYCTPGQHRCGGKCGTSPRPLPSAEQIANWEKRVQPNK